MFHVPEQYRIMTGRSASTAAYGNNGAFRIANAAGTRKCSHSGGKPEFFIIASDGLGWEHVSVHVYDQEGQRFLR